MNLINKDYVGYLLSDTHCNIRCHNIQEVKELIEIIKSDDRTNISHVHPLRRYEKRIKGKGYVDIFLHRNKKIWFNEGIYENSIVFDINPLY